MNKDFVNQQIEIYGERYTYLSNLIIDDSRS